MIGTSTDEKGALDGAASADEKDTVEGAASRSVDVCFDNQTGTVLYRKTFGLSHGIWSDDRVPPEQIAANSQGYWSSESDGVATGTEGFAEYYVGSKGAEGIVRVTWDNPWWQHDNNYSQSAPKGYKISHNGGDGANASVSFTLMKS